jgi:hypothetical protein
VIFNTRQIKRDKALMNKIATIIFISLLANIVFPKEIQFTHNSKIEFLSIEQGKKHSK